MPASRPSSIFYIWHSGDPLTPTPITSPAAHRAHKLNGKHSETVHRLPSSLIDPIRAQVRGLLGASIWCAVPKRRSIRLEYLEVLLQENSKFCLH
ncbi:hypothetical protein Nepgr_033370 [Nepenthes gracilis]|uniref:Uncharacterized protein n=1 Tax=Nepenthes gracilis TaxID=150966 RepID=A0AAD3Y6I9_NEPGR|nr:hypothetical protein Nepgr_033370 [Nepenthes gracilis]